MSQKRTAKQLLDRPSIPYCLVYQRNDYERSVWETIEDRIDGVMMANDNVIDYRFTKAGRMLIIHIDWTGNTSLYTNMITALNKVLPLKKASPKQILQGEDPWAGMIREVGTSGYRLCGRY